MPPRHTRVAIAYDFDGTLAKGNIQENSFIPDLGVSKKVFWKEVKEISREHEMDEVLAYMYLLLKKARASGTVLFNKDSLKAHGKNVSYFNGVEGYFKRINQYAKAQKINLEHYIISSGTKEMIEGTSIARHFKYIYASSFKYDQNGVPDCPALAINYTIKTQFLFRINKGIENAWDNSKINKFTPENNRPIPFKHMIYVGDGLTDVPAMRMVKSQGGISIGVYAPNTQHKSKVENLLKENRVSYVAAADYSEGKDLDNVLKAVIDQISANVSIKKYSGTSKKRAQSKTKSATGKGASQCLT